MKKRLALLFALIIIVGPVLTACGGGGDGGGDDPTAAVKDLFKAIEQKKFDKIPDYACEAQKEEARQTFDFGAIMAESLGGADVDPQKILDAMSFKMSGLEITEVSKSGDKATVHAKGKLEITVDEGKFRDVVKELLKAQGMEVSDEMLDQFIGPAMEQFKDFGQELDEDIAMVKEGGKWLICEP
jgi:hypothetical protein